MCGIAGILARDGGGPPALDALGRMVAALHHRGPDEAGVYRDRHVGLAHARLAILDKARGQQPMGDEAGGLWVSFNGEIFNHVELRAELEALGHRFRTRSDTEVLLEAWRAWGEAALHRFRGQWAFALWDAARRRLVLARDRVGIHPLHVCEHAGAVYFASEVKALFAAAPDLPRALDPAGLEETFTFWAALAPRTVFRGVSEVEPGQLVAFEGGRREARTWWRPDFPDAGHPPFAGDLDDAADALRAALLDSTALRMLRADVPVGSYLSGGLDSSLFAALGRRAVGSSFHTFSVRFEDAAYDETRWQRLVAGALDTHHHELVVTGAEVAAALPEVVRHAERPLLRTAPAPLFLLSRHVREAGIEVVLTGEGADEVFAGYDLFKEGKVRRTWARHPASEVRPRLLERLYPWLERSPVAQRAMARHFFGQDLDRAGEPGFAHGPRWRTTSALLRLFAPEARTGEDAVARLLADLPPRFPRWSPLAQDQYLEVRTLLSSYLMSSQGDRMLMAHGVEGRFPALDPVVMDLAASLPDRYKLRALDEKHVLKRVARDLLPPEVVRRPKQPYRSPGVLALAGPDAPPWVDALLEEAAVREAGVFAPRAVALLLRKCRAAAGRGPLSNADDMALTGVVTTQLLHDLLVRRAPDVVPPARLRTLVDRVAP